MDVVKPNHYFRSPVVYVICYLLSISFKNVSSNQFQKLDVHEAFNGIQGRMFDDDELNPLSFENLRVPVVVNTWNYTAANIKAWKALTSGKSPVDAIVDGISVCELYPENCDGQVGYGGNPDESGETTLDSMLMDGNTMKTGGVGGIRRIKNSVAVARHVLRNTKHSLIVGELATDFAKHLGFPEESLSSNYSVHEAKRWRYKEQCQPNFWVDVTPDPRKSCGPYTPKRQNRTKTDRNFNQNYRNGFRNYNKEYFKELPENYWNQGDKFNHDTITMIAINSKGEIAAGSSTNGLDHKIPGRVGDSPLAGAGVYADARVGAAIGTGDGDVMQRFVPSFLAVEEMRRGAGPSQAARTAVQRISEFYPNFWGAVVAVNKHGTYGAACSGMDKFPFSVTNNMLKETRVFWISCSE